MDHDIVMHGQLRRPLVPIQGVGFYTVNQDGYFEFSTYEDRLIDIPVPGTYGHNIAMVYTNGYSISFGVKVEQDARIMLMQVKLRSENLKQNIVDIKNVRAFLIQVFEVMFYFYTLCWKHCVIYVECINYLS